GGEADEDEEAVLGQDVDRHAAREQAGDGGEQAHRQDQDDRERQLPAFVLRDEDEKDEERGGAEDEERGRAAQLLLESEGGPLERNALRKHLVGQLFHALQRRAGGDARRRSPLHLGSRKQVVAWHAIGDRLAPQLRHRPDRHHLAGCIAGSEAGNVLRGAPELLVALYPDLIGAAEVVEVVHVLLAEVHLQRRKYVGWCEAYLFGFHPIDVGIDRRRAGVEQGEHTGEGRVLVGRRHERAGGFFQRLRAEPAPILQHHLEAARVAEALHRRR